MRVYSYPALPRLHSGVLLHEIRTVYPDVIGLVISGGVIQANFPNNTPATELAVGTILSAHAPPLTTAEDQVAQAREKADAKAAFESAMGNITKVDIDAMVDGISKLAEAKVYLRKLSYAVLYLLKREGL